MTKVVGRHTFKGGFYNNHSFKAQNVGGTLFQGNVDFSNDTNNSLDTGFGYANAALGVFSRYQQADKFVEGSMIYNNTEFYLQDNWKVTNRLTLDYGMRFTHQQPQYDQFQQMSNFFPDQWKAGPGADVLRRRLQQRRRRLLGQHAQRDGSPDRADPDRAAIPPTRRRRSARRSRTRAILLNGIKKAGDGIAKTGYTWPRSCSDPGSAWPTT